MRREMSSLEGEISQGVWRVSTSRQRLITKKVFVPARLTKFSHRMVVGEHLAMEGLQERF